MARPTKFSDTTAKAICLRIMEGESLRTICRDQKMPARSTVHGWLFEHEAFSDQYARAREVQADTLFDESLEIADDEDGDFIADREGDREIVRGNGVAVQRDRLRVDTRKWMAGKLRPKKYGDKVDIDLNAQVVGNVVFKGING
jgi:hypothetical protein